MRDLLCFASAALFAASCTTASPASSTGPTATTTTFPTVTGGRYMALGDSFTAGTGSAPDQSFPVRLVSYWSASAQGSCAVTLQNLGVNGYTTEDLIGDELPQLQAFVPQLVTLAIGANDIVHGSSAATYQSHVHQILAAIVAAGVKHIVAIPQPDWSQSPVAAHFGSPAALHASIVQWNAILRSETEAVSGKYVDLFPLMEAEAAAHMLAGDGLHPSATAYDAWAASLAKQVRQPCEK